MLLVFGLISVLYIVGGYLLLRIETLQKSDAEMKRDLNFRASELYVENVDHKLQKQLNEQNARLTGYIDRLTHCVEALRLANNEIKAEQDDIYSQLQTIKNQFEMSKELYATEEEVFNLKRLFAEAVAASKQVGTLESKKQKKTKKPAKAKRKRASK